MAKSESDKKLNARQQRFCELYAKEPNATKAAIGAGYSEKAAKEIGSENLTKPNILALIEKLRGKDSEVIELTREKQLAYYERMKIKYENEFPSASLKAAERQDKLLGFDAPIKAEISDVTVRTFNVVPASARKNV